MADHRTNGDYSKLGNAVEDAADRATEIARDQAEAATQTATRQAEKEVTDAAHAAEAASSEFEPGSVQAAAADQISTHLQDAASVLRETDFSAASKKATAFARDNPLLVLGGAALLGFAAARFLKASDASSRAAQGDDADPWTGHVTSTPRATPPRPPRTAPDEISDTRGAAV